MLLAADVGNTQTQLGLFRREELAATWRISTQPRRTADELAAAFRELFSLQGMSLLHDVSGVVVSSVVPSVTTALREMVSRYFRFEPLLLGPGMRTGMPVLTENPREVGADRIANAVGAYHLVGDAAIVIDFGTATTFDAVSVRGEYLGGAIAPGIEISANALSVSAAQIQKVEFIAPRSVIGRTTVESLRSGILLGSAALVDGMVERFQKELGGGAAVLATGGLAPLVLPECAAPIRPEPTLTLLGLRLIYERNEGTP
ncbi:MAG: type III pantothenate kinase [Actinomycetota bacterium]